MLREQKMLNTPNRKQPLKKNNPTLNKSQLFKMKSYINEIIEYNKHTNIVGKSTLINPWSSHILDSLQLDKIIIDKKSSILDMGSGAGLPGVVLAIAGYNNVSLIDSNIKKIKFLKKICKKINIRSKIYHQRIETFSNKKFDILTARALTNLNKLLFYSHKFIKNKTRLVFLKGIRTGDEIRFAKKYWNFEYSLKQSISDKRGKIIIITRLSRLNA